MQDDAAAAVKAQITSQLNPAKRAVDATVPTSIATVGCWHSSAAWRPASGARPSCLPYEVRPVPVDVGQTLKATLTFTPTANVVALNNNFNLRFGLFNWSGGSRDTTDVTTPNGANVKGYLLNLNFGTTLTSNVGARCDSRYQSATRSSLPSTILSLKTKPFACRCEI